MKATIKNISLITALSLLSISAFADNASTTTSSSSNSNSSSSSSSTSSLVGNYQCQRVDASNNSNAYSLAVTDNGKTYSFEWDNANGYPVLYGTGVIHPSKSNLVSVSFVDPKDANNYGIELFEIKSDGSLQSNWAVQSSNEVGSDTCTKGK